MNISKIIAPNGTVHYVDEQGYTYEMVQGNVQGLGFLKNLFKKKEGGTVVGNLIRKVGTTVGITKVAAPAASTLVSKLAPAATTSVVPNQYVAPVTATAPAEVVPQPQPKKPNYVLWGGLAVVAYLAVKN